MTRIHWAWLPTLLCLLVSVRAVAEVPTGHRFVRTIYLVRHGQYDVSVPGDDAVTHGLTPLGLAQAKLLAARLRGLPVTFTAMVTSPLTRARETAAVLHESLPQLTVEVSPLLRECTPRTWQKEAMQGAAPADLDAAEAQLNEAFAKYFIPARDADENVILVCHGNVTRYFVTKALGVDPQAWLGFGLAHCSLTVIAVQPDGACKVLAVGDIGHVPPNLQTGRGPADATFLVPRD